MAAAHTENDRFRYVDPRTRVIIVGFQKEDQTKILTLRVLPFGDVLTLEGALKALIVNFDKAYVYDPSEHFPLLFNPGGGGIFVALCMRPGCRNAVAFVVDLAREGVVVQHLVCIDCLNLEVDGHLYCIAEKTYGPRAIFSLRWPITRFLPGELPELEYGTRKPMF